MLTTANISAPYLSLKPTCCKVHKTIQEIDSKMLDYDKSISIHNVAEELHINSEELSASINILVNLFFIGYSDRKHENIFLTKTGRYAIVPE